MTNAQLLINIAIVAAFVGAPVLALTGFELFRRWRALQPRRRTIYASALAFVTLLYGLNAYAWFVEPNALIVRRVTVVSENWHGPPITIAALADVHVTSPSMPARRVEEIVRRVNALRPDLVLLLGDYVASHEHEDHRAPQQRNEVTNGIAYFAALDAPFGVVAITGNHDWYYGAAEIRTQLENAGVAVLRNRNITFRRGGRDIVIAGLADDETYDPSYAAAIDGAPANADIIAISHSPDVFPQIPSNVAMAFAGHTHCGQVWLPLLGRPIIPSRYGQRYACGLIRERGVAFFVSAGLGTSIIPARFMTPPEIALITLRGPARASTRQN